MSRSSKIDVKTIREIAIAHPRFAATLANLNKAGLTSTVYHVHWTPVKMSAEDVEAFLNSEGDNNPFYERLHKKIHQINKQIERGEIDPIEYEVRVDDTGSNTRLLSLRVINGSFKDPQYSLFDVRLVFEDSNLQSPIKADWTIK